MLVAVDADGAAVIARQLERTREPRVERMVGGFEAQHEQRAAFAGAGPGGFVGIDQPAVRRVELRLRQRAHRLGGLQEVGEAHRRAGAEARPRAHPHPGFRDDPQRALGTEQQALHARTGARTRQAARLERADRRDDAQRLDELVDVRDERREVTAGPRRDPAAERRVLEALREVTQREPVRLELRLERRTARAGLDASGERRAVDLEHAVEALEVEAHRRRVRLADRGLDAAAHARPAAERDRRGALAVEPVEQRNQVTLVAREGDQVGRRRHVPAEHAYRVGQRLAVGVRETLVGIVGEDRGERVGSAQPRRRQGISSTRGGAPPAAQ